MDKEKLKEIGGIIGRGFLIFGLLFLIFGGVLSFHNFGNGLLDDKKTSFCESRNQTFYISVSGGLGADKFICLDSNEERHEYYSKEVYN